MHIHLDAVGGIAGDMFTAAMLDAWPTLAPLVHDNVRQAGRTVDVQTQLHPYDDGVLTGRRFVVTRNGPPDEPMHHAHDRWCELRSALEASSLPAGVGSVAIGIFQELAEAEGVVHGLDPAEVTFHEVGNWDSIADIVAAATVIDAIQATSWSVGSLPLGSGTVETAHGRLPVPTPATALLLRGMPLHDDGCGGERVTPTGAAILRYLSPTSGVGTTPRTLERVGVGFGTRRLPGISNILRIMAFTDETAHADRPVRERVGVIQFEIDDQSPEELAMALERIRDDDGVLDVMQVPAFGKKGRMMSAIQILVRPDAVELVSALCFRHTTTLGLRMRVEDREILPRHTVITSGGARVKVAHRPGGSTAKTEIDDTQAHNDGQKSRSEFRRNAEAEALGGNHD